MKKDKNWLKEELSKQINILHTTISSGNYVSLVKRAEIMNLIDQLEEPEQEKVVIPQFVADYIEIAKQDINLIRVFDIANNHEELDKWKKEYEWIRGNHEKFAKAWFGYTVEKEKLYRVVLPDAESDASSKFLGLIRTGDNRIVISKIKVGAILHSDNVRFTEQEIKRNHEYLWQFAEEITK